MNVYLSNLQPDQQDSRDSLFEADKNATLPDEVDLSAHGGYRQNQRTTGNCTGQTMVNIGEMYLSSAGLFKDTPAEDEGDLSPRFNYFCSRELLGPQYLDGDPGSTARHALRAANKLGISRELFCPTVADKVNERPSAQAYADAERFKLGQYSRIPAGMNDDMIQAIMYALAKGWPVAVGMRVGQKLRDLPAGEHYSFLHHVTNPYWGNHEMLIVGYKRLPNRVLLKIENSWGADWCENGYFWTSALVVIVDMIDIWVAQGFAGIKRVGVDWTEYSPERTKIAQLYACFLKRCPELEGLDFWTNLYKSGWTTGQIAQALIDSPEGKTLYGAMTTEEFVTAMYAQVLNRAPDQAGFDYFVRLIKDGAQRGHIFASTMDYIAAYTGSDAGTKLERQYVENKTNVAMYYAVTLQMDGGRIDLARAALVGVTSDPRSAEAAKAELAIALGRAS